MPAGCSQAPAGPGAAAVGAAALQAMAAAAGHQDNLIRLTHQISADGVAVVTLHGDLDLATTDRTVRYVTGVIDTLDGLIRLDLSGLAFCDACGLGALIRIAAYADRAARRFELVNPSRAAIRIMRITGVDDRLLAGSLAGLGAGAPDPATGRG